MAGRAKCSCGHDNTACPTRNERRAETRYTAAKAAAVAAENAFRHAQDKHWEAWREYSAVWEANKRPRSK